ncbi:MAG: hypothetical protein OXC46_01790 [Thaumarchaeota archaeon]|nr:hypothetical protein [Nitrososphaerota archaeon]
MVLKKYVNQDALPNLVLECTKNVKEFITPILSNTTRVATCHYTPKPILILKNPKYHKFITRDEYVKIRVSD